MRGVRLKGTVNIEVVNEEIKQLETEKAALVKELTALKNRIAKIDAELEVYIARARFYKPRK